MKMPSIQIKNPAEASLIELQILARMTPDATDFWESNWCQTLIKFDLGPFHGAFEFDLRTDELDAFYHDLQTLYDNLSGTAALKTLEDQVSIILTCDTKGHIEASGFLRDQPGMGHKLTFEFTLDQTYLPQVLEGLGMVLKEFPVLYNPQQGTS